MSEFKVHVGELEGRMDALAQTQRVLEQARGGVAAVKRGLRVQIRQRAHIDSRLTQAMQCLDGQGQAVGRAVQTGRQAARLYLENESRFADLKLPPFPQISSDNRWDSSSDTEGSSNKPWEDQWICQRVPEVAMPPLDPAVPFPPQRNIFSFFEPGFIQDVVPATPFPPRKDIFSLFEPGSIPGIWMTLGLTGIGGGVVSGAIQAVAGLLGINVGGKFEGDFLGGSANSKLKAEWDTKKGTVGVSAEAEAKGHLAEGKFSGDFGAQHMEASVGLVTGAVSGKIGATLFKDGRFDPSLEAKATAKVSAVSGEVKTETGTEDFNVHTKASGDLLTAKAEFEAKVDKNGITASAGAEAYVAKGKVSGGFTLFGIKFDAEVEGKVGGAGVKAGGSIGKDVVSGELGAGLGLGASVKFSMDFSNAFWKAWGKH